LGIMPITPALYLGIALGVVDSEAERKNKCPWPQGTAGSLGLARSLHGRGTGVYGAKTVPKGVHGGAVRGRFVWGVWGLAPRRGGYGATGCAVGGRLPPFLLAARFFQTQSLHPGEPCFSRFKGEGSRGPPRLLPALPP
jgi:hypothetical protein